jgi:hypothetical protein
MLSIRAEGQSQKVALLPTAPKALVWKIVKLVCLQIQNCQRLFFAGCVCAETAVQEDGKPSVRRNRRRCRKIVRRLRVTRHLAKQLPIGQPRWLLNWGSRLRTEFSGQNCY